jgi:hypothetical protein
MDETHPYHLLLDRAFALHQDAAKLAAGVRRLWHDFRLARCRLQGVQALYARSEVLQRRMEEMMQIRLPPAA